MQEEPQQYHIRLTRVTSLLVISTQNGRTYTGTKEQLAAIYKKILIHNLLLGWWGLGIVWNVMALLRNARVKRALDLL